MCVIHETNQKDISPSTRPDFGVQRSLMRDSERRLSDDSEEFYLQKRILFIAFKKRQLTINLQIFIIRNVHGFELIKSFIHGIVELFGLEKKSKHIILA